LAREVAGLVRRKAAIAEALAAEAVDFASTSLAAVINDADLIVLCTPVAEMAVLVNDLAPLMAPGALVTDVGSVKAAVIAAAESPIERAGAGSSAAIRSGSDGSGWARRVRTCSLAPSRSSPPPAPATRVR
jgi:cyclohexadieny/prephenate dehydrogenase